jgi:hypothetical protein
MDAIPPRVESTCTLRHRPLAAMLVASTLAVVDATAIAASTHYVSTTGVDAPGGGTPAAPFRTIGYGLARLASGDTLVVFDGLYENEANFINDGIHAIPSGTASANTVIRAANPFRVRIRNVAPTDYYDSPLRVRGDYVRVDGFVFDLRDTASTPLVGEVGGSYNRITRSIFRRQGTVDQYGGWLRVNGHHQLVEDVGGVGAARYGFATGGPTDDSHHVIYRRVVGRFDFSPSTQPKATFNAYGTDSGWGVHHILYQNCIAVNGQRAASGGGEEHYGAWYFPKNVDAAAIVGSIALDNAVAYAGMFVQELQGRNTVVDNSVIWQSTGGAGLRWNGTGSIAIDNVTIGNHLAAMRNANSTTPAVLHQGYFVGNTQLFQSNSGFGEFSGSAFVPAAQAYGTGVVTPTGPLRYLPDAGDGTGLVGVGAVILKRVGRSGTVWDEPGFDETTAQDLWPWPYEDELKAVFAEPNTPLAGNTPATNDTVRGFTVATDAFGRPMTLTRYVWQFLGTEIPASIYANADRLFADGFQD